MAEALRVVSAPDAFMQNDQAHRSIALPCFSFNKRGALVKSMSRKHSTASSGIASSMQFTCQHCTMMDKLQWWFDASVVLAAQLCMP